MLLDHYTKKFGCLHPLSLFPIKYHSFWTYDFLSNSEIVVSCLPTKCIRTILRYLPKIWDSTSHPCNQPSTGYLCERQIVFPQKPLCFIEDNFQISAIPCDSIWISITQNIFDSKSYIARDKYVSTLIGLHTSKKCSHVSDIVQTLLGRMVNGKCCLWENMATYLWSWMNAMYSTSPIGVIKFIKISITLAWIYRSNWSHEQ